MEYLMLGRHMTYNSSLDKTEDTIRMEYLRLGRHMTDYSSFDKTEDTISMDISG